MRGTGRRFDACFRHHGLRIGLALAASVAVLLPTACTHAPRVAPQARPIEADSAVYLVLRHAEKADDGSRDPDLNDAGHARAGRIAEALRDAPLVAVYATAYRRTQATAAPSAAMHGLEVRTYEAGGPAETFAATLRSAHPSGTVLVIGHSNTAPAIAATLCACPVAPMDDHSYGRWIEVRIGPDGRARLSERAY